MHIFSDPVWTDPSTYPPVPASMTKTCDNHSVGVIVTDPDGRILMFQRSTPPIGIAPVAGHVDDHGGVEAAARAEVAEEVGLTVLTLSPVTTRWRRNICRRQHGPIGPGHNWTIFRAEVAGTVCADPDEARDARWYTRDEIQQLTEQTLAWAYGRMTADQFATDPGIEPVWVEFLHYLRIIDVTSADLAAVERLASQSPYTSRIED